MAIMEFCIAKFVIHFLRCVPEREIFCAFANKEEEEEEEEAARSFRNWQFLISQFCLASFLPSD